MYLIMGVLSPSRHLVLATPLSARAAIDSYLAAKETFADVLVNDPAGRPIDFDILNSLAVMEIDAESFGDDVPRTLH